MATIIDDKKLDEIKKAEKEILIVFDKFCKDNNLRYSLFAGTALGAVRHKGFIPWDDDIDVCMVRDEYEKFLALWGEQTIEDCYLQSKSNPNYALNHEKIRSTKPAYKGIFIDVFPLDKIPDNKRKRKTFMLYAKLRLIYTRNYPYKSGGKVLELISRMLLAAPNCLKRRMRNLCDRKVKKYNSMDKGFGYICLTCPDDLRYVYQGTIMNSFEDINFEGMDFTISSEYDTILKVLYNDYMTLPPEEERVCKHFDESDL